MTVIRTPRQVLAELLDILDDRQGDRYKHPCCLSCYQHPWHVDPYKNGSRPAEPGEVEKGERCSCPCHQARALLGRGGKDRLAPRGLTAVLWLGHGDSTPLPAKLLREVLRR